VAQLLRAYKDYRRIFDDMYYWAPAGGIETEVNLIVVYPHGPVMRTDDGIDVVPFAHFAGLLAQNRL